MFGWGSSKPAPASTPTEAPNREQRAACWRDRDEYFACLDKFGVQVIGTEGENCKKERAAYEGSCGRSWVSCSVSPWDHGRGGMAAGWGEVETDMARRALHCAAHQVTDKG
jgi:cytochrome c oxidase assembly factor 6